jgi:hypothetical protein
MVGRFVEQVEIRLGERQRRKARASRLPAAQRARRPRDVDFIEAEAFERRVDTLRLCPVRRFDASSACCAGFDPCQTLEVLARAEQIGDGPVRPRRHRLAQHTDPAADAYGARERRDLAEDETEHRRLADAIASDEARALAAERQADAVEQAAPVRQRE